MVLVPRFGQREVQEQPVATSDREVRTSAAPAAFGSIGAADLASSGEVLSKIAEQEQELLAQKFSAKMLSQVSQFDVESQQRLNEMQMQGTGEEPFVAAVMNDTKQRVDELVNQQPEFLRQETRARLLPIQARIAKSAVSTATIQAENEIKKDAADFTNNLVNRVRFGLTPEEQALEQVGSFTGRMPQSLREAQQEASVQAVRQASLSNFVSQDPEAAVAAIESGQFNDVAAPFLESSFNQANKAIVARKTAVQKAQQDAQKYRFTDPARAATLQLQSEGIEQPTIEEMREAQDRLNIPRSKQRFITKSQAEEVANQLTAATNVNEFLALREEILQTTAESGVPTGGFLSDVEALADMSPALGFIIDADPFLVDNRFMSSAVQLMADPNAASAARKQIIQTEGDPATGRARITQVESDVFEVVADELSVMAKAGVGEVDRAESMTAMVDLGTIIYSQERARGRSNSQARKAVSDAFESLDNQRVVVNNGRDAYILPTSAAQVLGERQMAALRDEIIDNANLQDLSGFPNRELFQQDLKQRAFWSMADNQTLVLRAGGQPVFREVDGRLEPVEFSVQQLTNLAARNPVDPRDDPRFSYDELVRISGGR